MSCCTDKPSPDYKALEIARLVGVVPQTFSLDFSFTVEEMVAMGRYAHTAASSPQRHARLDRGRARPGDRGPTRHGPHRPRRTAPSPNSQAASVNEPSSRRRWRKTPPPCFWTNRSTTWTSTTSWRPCSCSGRSHSEGRTVVVVAARPQHGRPVLRRAACCSTMDAWPPEARPAEVLDPRLILEVFKARVSVHRQGRRPYVTPVWSEPVASRPSRGQRGARDRRWRRRQPAS